MLPLLTLGVTAVKAHNYNSVSSPTLEFRALQKRGKKKKREIRQHILQITKRREMMSYDLPSALCAEVTLKETV